MQRCQKNTFYVAPIVIVYNENTKMWMIHLDILEMFVILPLKKEQSKVLEQSSVLCHLCYFPATTAGKEEANSLCKFLGFHTFNVCCFSFKLIHKNSVHEQSATHMQKVKVTP
jgi:hypothetical protein